MRFILASLVIIVGTTIGVNAINSVSQMQDAKMTRFCKSVPVGKQSHDEMCKDFVEHQSTQFINQNDSNQRQHH